MQNVNAVQVEKFLLMMTHYIVTCLQKAGKNEAVHEVIFCKTISAFWINIALRKPIGINLNNPIQQASSTSRKIDETIEKFFLHEDVSRVSHGTKKVATNSLNQSDKRPARYQLGHLKLLFSKFVAESGVDISYATPSAADWGTCFFVVHA